MSKIKELISELKHMLEWSQPISRYNEILGIVNAIEIELEPKVVKVVETKKVETPKIEEKVVETPKVDEIVVETPKVEDSKPKPQGRKK